MTRQEFTEQIVPLKNKLFRFARRILGHTEEAEDAVQEVFVKLWTKREQLDEYRSVEALAMITAKNLCLDKLRSKKYPVDPIDNHRAYLENLPEKNEMDYSEEVRKIHVAMKSLPRQQQMILQLRDIEGYDFESIAEMLDMNENAIRVNLSRARKRIREMILTANTYELQRN